MNQHSAHDKTGQNAENGVFTVRMPGGADVTECENELPLQGFISAELEATKRPAESDPKTNTWKNIERC